MNRELVDRLYAALARGDRAAVESLLAPHFQAEFTKSLPFGIGGCHLGTEAIDRGWWAIGRAYSIRAEPDEYVDTADGRLLVLGRYRGSARATGVSVEAAFAHLWSADRERLTGLVQITDGAPWLAAL
jgi:2-(1,2-epoxy-1,2-dihydrophenyl)acetyl-CoA isomerase